MRSDREKAVRRGGGSPRVRRGPVARLLGAAVLALALPCAAQPDTAADAVVPLQQDWEVLRYQTVGPEREKGYAALAERAHAVSDAYPGRVEPLVWEGVIVSSWANEKSWITAYPLRRRAKALYEAAFRLDGKALDGAVYDGLGMLYHRALPWPIDFGDDAVAEELLKQALKVSPRGLDANFFYGTYLVDKHREEEAAAYLERALQAPLRAGRQVADTGRREEARALLDRARAHAR